jgi:CheY-like chemotaxis protein
MMEAWPDRSRLETTLEQLLSALNAARDGDFSMRLPGSSDSLLDDIAAAYNGLMSRLGERQVARSQFLPALSHELRTPLNSMVVLASLLAQNADGNLTAEQVEYANVIHSAGADLVGVISDLVDPDRQGPGSGQGHSAADAERGLLVVEPTHSGLLTLLARGALSDLAETGGPTAVRTAITPDEVAEVLTAGPHQCVVLDLAAGGTLPSRTLERVRAHPHCCHIPVLAYARHELAAAQYTLLRKGERAQPLELLRSPEELRERIAWHLSAARETGLGLPGPTVPAQVAGGPTTTGPVTTGPVTTGPVTTGPATTGSANGTPRHAALRGKKILVVDDDPRNVFAIKSTLELYGMTVLRSGDGRSGIDQLVSEPDTDLVLMDLMMPGMDGYTAISTIRDMPEFSELPIIAVTARTFAGDWAASVPGANDCLTKPLDTDELLGRMTRCLA